MNFKQSEACETFEGSFTLISWSKRTSVGVSAWTIKIQSDDVVRNMAPLLLLVNMTDPFSAISAILVQEKLRHHTAPTHPWMDEVMLAVHRNYHKHSHGYDGAVSLNRMHTYQ
ncbi:uncharacterized protein B0T23DRAFT_85776 [Neurospora hispaniola]|uniref:Uncharacterized protein n=1 Tax=Neurospora hispaniola TaxID=588809 RepID=A0AAJ0MUE5_9PEZI|nr:hypothetical protein B0T23DRAFT_85776 [Neurospora hispaniola]